MDAIYSVIGETIYPKLSINFNLTEGRECPGICCIVEISD
jgi:hypothetical protein